MKLSEAIEEVSHKDYPNLTVLTIKKKEAFKLLIEAGEFYLDSSHFACGCLLPGQTAETEE